MILLLPVTNGKLPRDPREPGGRPGKKSYCGGVGGASPVYNFRQNTPTMLSLSKHNQKREAKKEREDYISI